MTLKRFDHSRDSVVATDSQVVALGDVMGQDNSRSLANSGKDSEKNSPLQGLSLINDHKGVVE